MTAPERIYMDGDIEVGDGHWSRCFETPKKCGDPAIEYVRADLHDATKAQLAECEARLRKAVAALREIRLEYDPSDDSLNSRTMYDIACDVLAEIEKGGV